jgi:hypothetical protein
MELRGDLRAVRVDAIGQRGQAGQEAVVGNRGLVRLHRAGRPGDPGHAGDDEAGPALGLLLVIGDQPLADRAVGLGQADAHRGDEDAVADIERADPARRKQVGVAGGHAVSPTTIAG